MSNYKLFGTPEPTAVLGTFISLAHIYVYDEYIRPNLPADALNFTKWISLKQGNENKITFEYNNVPKKLTFGVFRISKNKAQEISNIILEKYKFDVSPNTVIEIVKDIKEAIENSTYDPEMEIAHKQWTKDFIQAGRDKYQFIADLFSDLGYASSVYGHESGRNGFVGKVYINIGSSFQLQVLDYKEAEFTIQASQLGHNNYYVPVHKISEFINTVKTLDSFAYHA